MLKNPILKDMSIDDLNQRYRDTYVLYNQVPYYTYGFRKSTMRGVRVDINLCSLAELHNGDNGGWKGSIGNSWMYLAPKLVSTASMGC